MSASTRLNLPLLDAAQAQKHVTHNEALIALDGLIQLSVSARNIDAPPAAPTEGDRVLVGAAPTGAFVMHAGCIAAFDGGGWIFSTPRAGWRVYVRAENALLVHDGTVWNDIGLNIRTLQNVTRLGIGTSADAANPLAAKLNSVLLTALASSESGTGDLRVAMNKSAAANTVSQIYQTNYSGRAEAGLAGDDHFRIKVSADGAVWKSSLDIDPASGLVSFPSGVAGGLAVLRNGAGAPPDVTGASGDFWIDTLNNRLYGPRGLSTWPAVYVSLIGPAGANGAPGAAGLAGAAGAIGPAGTRVLNGSAAPAAAVGNNNDFYIDTAASILYGPKAAGAWPVPGVSLTPSIKSFYVNPSVGSTGNGSESAPYLSLSDAVASATTDASTRTLELYLKPGVLRAPIIFDSARFRKILIRGQQGRKTIIRPSELWTSGWTNVSGDVWVHAATFAFAYMTETTSGITQTFGRTGSYSVPWIVYDRLADNQTTATMQACTVPTASYQATGTYAGKVMIRARTGVSPNACSFEHAIASSGLGTNWSSDANWNHCEFIAENLEVQYAVQNNWLSRTRGRLENIISRGCWGYAFQFDQSDINGYGLFGEGTLGDGVNLYGGTGGETTSLLDAVPQVRLWDCDMFGMGNVPSGQVGDGFSNHAGQHMSLHGCRAWACGKDGLSMIDNFKVVGFEARDCSSSGITFAPSVTAARASVHDALLVGNYVNAIIAKGTIDLKRVTMRDSARIDLQAVNSACTINATDCMGGGSVGSLASRTYVNGAGIIANLLNSTTLNSPAPIIAAGAVVNVVA